MTLNDVVFYGFTPAELEAIRKETELTGKEEYTITLGNRISEVVGDIMTIVQPSGQISIIKAGKENE